jgi:manganese/zinc/iron transport system ATP- binding protein
MNEVPVIEVHNLSVSYGKKPALWNLDFTLPKGKKIGVIGPNGSGKTTFLKTLMGLLKPDFGYVKVYGESLEANRNRISYVPQRESVDWDFPASVLDVVKMGRYNPKAILKKLSKEDLIQVDDALEKVGMTNFANRHISELSGGQQQRVFLARALCRQPDLYIMDEPFAGVDAATEQAILNILDDLNKQGKTVIVVHHDLETARSYFDWIALLNTRLIACGPKEEVFTKENLADAYGGQLTVLSKLAHIVEQEDFPLREKK